jgi:C-terminal processing protease CtpA/Prc
VGLKTEKANMLAPYLNMKHLSLGKLGIVIDTTLEGPIVHKINPQSPLEGSLFPGDIIVAIDDVDTRAMSASAITALMVRTANLRRTLTVLSEDVNP